MSTEPTTVASEADLDDDIIETVIFLRLRRVRPATDGRPPVEQADVEAALARFANDTPAFPVRARHGDERPNAANITAEHWIIERNTPEVITDPEQVEAARWAVTPQ